MGLKEEFNSLLNGIKEIIKDRSLNVVEKLNAVAGKIGQYQSIQELPAAEEGDNRSFWQWRYRMAENIALKMNFKDFGVKAFYLFGSTKNCTAGMGSDIDILIHFIGNDAQRLSLLLWLDGWSKCLAEMNFLRTGYESEGLLDIHLVTDEDIQRRTSFAVKIGAVSDAALLLKKDL